MIYIVLCLNQRLSFEYLFSYKLNHRHHDTDRCRCLLPKAEAVVNIPETSSDFLFQKLLTNGSYLSMLSYLNYLLYILSTTMSTVFNKLFLCTDE